MSKHWLMICAAAGPLLAQATQDAHAQDPEAGNYVDAHVHVWTPATARYPLATGPWPVAAAIRHPVFRTDARNPVAVTAPRTQRPIEVET